MFTCSIRIVCMYFQSQWSSGKLVIMIRLLHQKPDKSIDLIHLFCDHCSSTVVEGSQKGKLGFSIITVDTSMHQYVYIHDIKVFKDQKATGH